MITISKKKMKLFEFIIIINTSNVPTYLYDDVVRVKRDQPKVDEMCMIE